MNTSFTTGISLTNNTTQKLTPQMQQAIRLLQMSSIELEQEVQCQLDNNPLLDRYEEDEHDTSDHLSDDILNQQPLNESISGELAEELVMSDQLGNPLDNQLDQQLESYSYDDNYESSYEDSYDKLTNSSLDESSVDTDWNGFYTHGNSSMASLESLDSDSYQGNTTITVQDHVRWQLNFKHLSKIDMLIADYLIDAMDDSGLISIDITELQYNLEGLAIINQWADTVEPDEIETVIHMIQSCEPIGVGARNLSECLLLQLNKLDSATPYIENARKILDYSQHLLTNNLDALLSKTKLSISDIDPALSLLRTLNHSPGSAYTNGLSNNNVSYEPYDIPDVLVHIRQKNDQTSNNHKGKNATPDSTIRISQSENQQSLITWEVCLNPDTLPKLRVNQTYAKLIKRGDNSPDNQYLKSNLIDAKLFIHSIQERNSNLLKVATSIVKHQEQFLLHGAASMKPLILKEVADEVALHESTVSRLTNSKSMLTPQGLFALKYFFSSSVSSNEGEVSSTAICAMLKEMIIKEDPKKPLSDSSLVTLFNAKGITVARRTVAKYREQLHIRSSIQRKQKY